ncbi:hypothetical protein BKA60DRAFT_583095 [Fusarium oxysporum]|nr:hypothetical protein BKA60DRAFT_583095 [Fusarium oxysporum]
MASTSQEEGKLFKDLKADIIQASRDLDKEAEIVQDVEASRADRVPWLVHTGFPTHLQGLHDTEIMSSYALPRSGDDDDDDGDGGDDDDGEEEGGAVDTDIDLRRILAAVERTLRDAYKLCSDKSPDRKMTQQRAKRLSNFRSDDSHISSAKASKFRSFKNELSLTSYFRIIKQLLAYYYRVVYREDGHFTREGKSHVVPQDIIETTPLQRQAMEDVIGALRRRDKAAKGRGAPSCDKKEAEIPFGHVLQWRLYLFAASRTSLTKHQARWSLDGETVNYMGTKLHMEQVTQLVESEFRQAHSLLYDKLLFGMRDVAPIEAWRLHDDLDVDDYGASWLIDERNREILAGTHDALLRQIEERADLRQVFVRLDLNGGVRLCPKAIAIYEAHVQEFLKRILAPISVPSGPPLRSPELLSITYINTGARRRSVFLWEKTVMIYEKDNIRFLPPAVGNLLLTYLAFVLPLRQAFLRQSKPGALLSPYLWSKLGGEVWRDGMVSSCLRREKFSAREQANFDIGEIAASKEVEDKADLAYLAGMSNYSFRTFNYSYAGSTTLTVISSLHRAYRASQS